MSIKVDPRIELLTIVQYLGQYDRIFNYPLIDRCKDGEKKGYYQSAIEEYFHKFSKHNAVKISDQLANLGFSFDAPVGLLLQYSDLPELLKETEIPMALLNRIGDSQKPFSFIDALRDFAEKTNFLEFFEQQEGYYNSLIDSFGEITEHLNFAEQLENYLNLSENRLARDFSIILSPLSLGNYSSVRIEKHKIYPFSILGVSPRLIANYLTKERLGSLCWHEFAHTYINPLTAQSLDLVEKSSSLFSQIEERMKGQAYPEWKICINETIIRAIANRLMLHHFGETLYLKSVQGDLDKGFIFIKEIEEVIVSFEQDGILTPSIKECHREVLLRLVELSNETRVNQEEVT